MNLGALLGRGAGRAQHALHVLHATSVHATAHAAAHAFVMRHHAALHARAALLHRSRPALHAARRRLCHHRGHATQQDRRSHTGTRQKLKCLALGTTHQAHLQVVWNVMDSGDQAYRRPVAAVNYRKASGCTMAA